jgi:transposase
MSTSRRYPKEVRERTVRLVFEHEQNHPSQWSAVRSIAQKFGMNAETLRKWVRQAKGDNGGRPGPSTEERGRLCDLEKENQELRRANEILKAASAFLGAELDRRHK